MFFAHFFQEFLKYLKSLLVAFLKLNIIRNLKAVPVNEIFLSLVFFELLEKAWQRLGNCKSLIIF